MFLVLLLFKTSNMIRILSVSDAVESDRESLLPFRSETSLDPLVQVLEVLITSEVNMNQAAPGVYARVCVIDATRSHLILIIC